MAVSRWSVWQRKITAGAVVVAALALLLGVSSVVSAQDFPTRNIRWIVPYTAGGGFDTYSRGVAEIMSRNHTPPGVHVVVDNVVPVHQGLTNLFTARPDGYTIGILPMPAAASMEVSMPGIIQWVTNEYTVLGSVDENAYVIYVRGDGPYENIEQLMNTPNLTALTVEHGSSSSLASLVAIQTLGMDARLIYGAEGSHEVATALVRGDVDFIVYGAGDLVGFVESGDMRPVLFLGREDQRPANLTWLADVPSIADIGYPEAAGAVSELRVIVSSPGLPEHIAEQLRTLVWNTLNDPDFIAWSEQANRPIVPRDAESAREALEAQVNYMRELIPQLQEAGLM